MKTIKVKKEYTTTDIIIKIIDWMVVLVPLYLIYRECKKDNENKRSERERDLEKKLDQSEQKKKEILNILSERDREK